MPGIVYDPSGAANARLADVPKVGFANLAATCITLLGFEPPEDYAKSLVDVGLSVRSMLWVVAPSLTGREQLSKAVSGKAQTRKR